MRVEPEAVTAAAGHARRASTELDGVQVRAGRALSAAGEALDPASRALLTELVQSWGILGSQLAPASGALAASLASAAERCRAAEQALGAAFRSGRP